MFFSYFNTTNLARYQDRIIKEKLTINETQAKKFTKELRKYKFLVEKKYFNINPIAVNNLAIRYYVILAALYAIQKDTLKRKKSKNKADTLYKKFCKTFYVEGYSYFLYVKSAYDFYYETTNTEDAHIIEPVLKHYKKIVAPDSRIPTTDTAYTDLIERESVVPIEQHFPMYSVYNRNNKYIFINHFSGLYDYANDGHVNFEFGHFCIFSNGWKVLHKWYPGYDKKKGTEIRKSWNENILYQRQTKNHLWRIFKPKLRYVRKDNEHNFSIARSNRNIEVKENSVIITDTGRRGYSSFNISDDCKFRITKGTHKTDTGFHSHKRGEVSAHKRLKLYGRKREIIFYL